MTGTRYTEYIVESLDGQPPREVTCDPEQLNNAFNSRPGMPSYFTPVFFARAVLDRYYSRPDLYAVGEAGLSCKGTWNVRMDASRSDFVAMMLGDLGKYLPFEDQLHWRSCNVPPHGGFSKEFTDRNFRNRASYWTQPDHAFIDRFSGFKLAWREKCGWPLFLELDERDQYLLDALHVPLQGTQAEFDGQVLALATILCDSVNAKGLLQRIGDTENNRQLAPIGRLEKWLQRHSVADFEEHVGFLRDLQSLRSAGSAHRKGSKYKTALRRLGIEGLLLDKAFAQLLVAAMEALDFLGTLDVGLDPSEERR